VKQGKVWEKSENVSFCWEELGNWAEVMPSMPGGEGVKHRLGHRDHWGLPSGFGGDCMGAGRNLLTKKTNGGTY